MKLYKIVNAGASLRRLAAQELSLQAAYRLSLLVNQLNPHLGYFDSNREQISRLADSGDAELDALLQEDIGIHVDPVKIQLNEAAKLSVLDVMQLEGFVEFVEAGESSGESR